jgi:hypothetical protein
MDHRTSADEFFASIGMQRPRLSPGERISITAVATDVLAFLSQSGDGPYTLLLPATDELDDLGFDLHQPDQTALDGVTGWMLDLVLFGDLLSTNIDESLANAGGELELSTVGGSSIRVTRKDGKVAAIDPWGVRGTVSEALFKGPRVTTHSIDAPIMWQSWKDYLLAPRRMTRP